MVTTPASEPSCRIAVDVGGTFTDGVCVDAAGEVRTAKDLTTYPDPAPGVIAVLAQLAAVGGQSLSELVAGASCLVHGTTITTNALITGNVARIGLLATEGFRDSLEMRLGKRDDMYDNLAANPEPLVQRALRLGIPERTLYTGAVERELDATALEAALGTLREAGVDAVAVSFLHGHQNPTNEQKAGQRVADSLPDAYVSLGSELTSQIGYYERTSTACVNAAVGPLITDYLDGLEAGLAAVGFGAPLLLMQSNGGMCTPATARREACNSLLSGPAAGVVAGQAVARAQGFDRCVTLDMGGTSCDVSVLDGGTAPTTAEAVVEGHPVRIPMLDVRAVGAGGGSIAWIDAGGILRVGPASARSDPGPACYGRGGSQPTVTDACLALGLVDGRGFGGGAFDLDPEAACAALAAHVAEPLGISVEDAALAVHHLVSVNMGSAVRQLTVERGQSPQDYALIVGGGAGPLHAAALLRETRCGLALVPALGSVLSASGMLLCDIRTELVQTCHLAMVPENADDIFERYLQLSGRAARQLAAEGVGAGRVVEQITLEIHYEGQFHEVPVPAAAGELAPPGIPAVLDRFHARHDQLHGYAVPGAAAELVNLRVGATGQVERIDLERLQGIRTTGGRRAADGPATRRARLDRDVGWEDVDVLGADDRWEGTRPGPLLVDLATTSIAVPRGYRISRDGFGNYALRRSA